MKPLTVYLGPEAEKTRVTLELKARKSLNGNIIILDHKEIDIVVMPSSSKIVTFAKDDFSETVYEAQDRFFTYLKRKGIVSYESIQGGAVFGSIEGLLEESSNAHVSPVDYALYNISKFLKQEQPYYDYIDDYEKMLDDYLTHPTDADSTELGEVPQAAEKGNVRPGFNYEPYWMSYMLEEEKKK
jgi:hypothetical protein